MNLTKHSRSRLTILASRWTVPKEYFDPLYNYLVHGFEPGSFWTAVLANDWHRAISSSHPGNTVDHLKMATGWIHDSFPVESYGGYSNIKQWLELDPIDRRMILEDNRLIYTEQEEIMLGLKGVQPTPEPRFW
jgi:hypothetical protein